MAKNETPFASLNLQDFGTHGVKYGKIDGVHVFMIADTADLRRAAPKPKAKEKNGALVTSRNRLLANSGGFQTVPGGMGLKVSLNAIVPDDAAG